MMDITGSSNDTSAIQIIIGSQQTTPMALKQEEQEEKEWEQKKEPPCQAPTKSPPVLFGDEIIRPHMALQGLFADIGDEIIHPRMALQDEDLGSTHVQRSGDIFQKFHEEMQGGRAFQKYVNGKAVNSEDFGEVNFVGQTSVGLSNPKYIRVTDNTDPGKLRYFIEKEWGVRKPGVVISVTGGANTLGLSSFMTRNIKKGLMEGALKTGAWVTTGGTDNGEYGVMRLVGEAAVEVGGQVPVFGVATWGCIQDNEQLTKDSSVRRDDTANITGVPYQKRTPLEGKSAYLDSNHGFFLLVDSGEQKWGGEGEMRAKLESAICQPGAAWVAGGERTRVGGNTWEMASTAVPAEDEMASTAVPAEDEGGDYPYHTHYPYHEPDRQAIHEVVVAIGGGPNTIIHLKNAVAKNMPTIVVNESGRAGSLVSLAKTLFELNAAHGQGFNRAQLYQLLRGVEVINSPLAADAVAKFHNILFSEFRTAEKRDDAVHIILRTHYTVNTILPILYSPHSLCCTHRTHYTVLTILTILYSPHSLCCTYHTPYTVLTALPILYIPYSLYCTHHTHYTLTILTVLAVPRYIPSLMSRCTLYCLSTRQTRGMPIWLR
jgi:hypothetical protein